MKRRALGPPGFVVALALAWAGRAQAEEQPTASPPAPFSTTVTGPAPASATPREDSAAAATVLLPAETPRAHDDLGTMLLEVPGVSVARTGSSFAFTSVTLRGSNPDEVLIFVDGVPLNLAQGGGVDISTLPLGDVERVEVYRGTTPLAFGESALGGVISIVTRTPGRTGALLRAGVGSFGTFYGDATAGGHVGRIRFYVGAHVYATGGDYLYFHDRPSYDPRPGLVQDTRANNDALEGNGMMRMVATLRGRRTLSLGLLGFGRVQGLPNELKHLPTMAARFHTARGLGYLRYESRDDLGPGGRLSAQLFTSLQRDRLLDPDGEVSARGPTTAHDTTVSTGASVFGSRPLADWGRASVVLEGRRETYTLSNETAPSLSSFPARRFVAVGGGEIEVRWPAIDLRLLPSVRLEGIDDVIGGINTTGNPQPAGPPVTHLLPIYRLGLVRPLGEAATFKANVGRYARAPSFLELYGSGNSRLLGNPALRPEHGENADLAVWIDRAGPRVSVVSRTTLFGALAQDLIIWPQTAGGYSRAENLAAARIYGLEQEIRLALGHHARLVGQGTYTVALDESGASASQGKQIPQHPRVTGYLRPELVHLTLPAGIDVGAYADAALRSGAYSDPANLQRYSTELLFGAGVTALLPRAHLRATLSALNLTDLSTFEVESWPLPGRTVFLALAYEPVRGGADEWGGSGLSGFGYP